MSTQCGYNSGLEGHFRSDSFIKHRLFYSWVALNTAVSVFARAESSVRHLEVDYRVFLQWKLLQFRVTGNQSVLPCLMSSCRTPLTTCFKFYQRSHKPEKIVCLSSCACGLKKKKITSFFPNSLSPLLPSLVSSLVFLCLTVNRWLSLWAPSCVQYVKQSLSSVTLWIGTYFTKRRQHCTKAYCVCVCYGSEPVLSPLLLPAHMHVIFSCLSVIHRSHVSIFVWVSSHSVRCSCWWIDWTGSQQPLQGWSSKPVHMKPSTSREWSQSILESWAGPSLSQHKLWISSSGLDLSDGISLNRAGLWSLSKRAKEQLI